MKAQKCPKCGHLNEIPDGYRWMYCNVCPQDIQNIEPVEIIDWQDELITNNENLKK